MVGGCGLVFDNEIAVALRNEFGGETYFCPSRSVPISTAPTQNLKAVQMQRMRSIVVEQENAETRPRFRPCSTRLPSANIIMFRAEARILNR